MGKTREPKFEEAVEELESIIAKIEAGECGLEECISEYERGVKLLSHCQSILQVVQQRIAELTATNAGGKLRIKASGPADTPPGAEVPLADDPETPGVTIRPFLSTDNRA